MACVPNYSESSSHVDTRSRFLFSVKRTRAVEVRDIKCGTLWRSRCFLQHFRNAIVGPPLGGAEQGQSENEASGSE